MKRLNLFGKASYIYLFSDHMKKLKVSSSKHGPIRSLTPKQIWDLYPEEAKKFQKKVENKLLKDIQREVIPDDKLRQIFPDIDFEGF